MKEDYREWTADEYFARARAIREGGIEGYRASYQELLNVQGIYLARAGELGLDPGYISELFARCREAFQKEDTKAMKDRAEECAAFGKIEDMGTIGTGHPELKGLSTRIVQLASALASFPMLQ